ncbi:MAG: hybrid sensor histidine kinase/response regulator, partial [Proteobacteria bacterium]|nr:hybrid sensor histidine kinase/response regulator [Pseudomonadota bacterium]
MVFAYETTDQVIARNELETLAQKTQIASIAKSQFMANMSHEIRTPLGAILGFTELLKNENLDKAQREQYIDIISRNGQTLTKIIDDILDLSKIEAGRMQFEILPVSIESIVSDVMALFQEKARSKNIDLISRVDAKCPQIYSDATKLRQILVNIVGNAVKFTDMGKVTITGFVELSTSDTCLVTISVSDTGPGMTQDQAEKLFQPFTQADYSSTRKYGGTGLGLALSRQLANALHGDLHIAHTKVGEGSVFELTLESKIVRNDYSTNFEFVHRPKDLDQLDMKVLLVEDSLDNQMFIQHILAQHGVKVDTANDGLQGVQRALNGNYDVV